MAENDKAVAALTIATKTCAAALAALAKTDANSDQRPGSELHRISTDPNSDIREAPLQTLLADYSSLLSLVYASTTKIALTLKPSDPTYSAALLPLQDVTKHADALASCACSIHPGLHGKTLARETRWATEAVVNALQVFLDCFLDDPPETESYLVRTGAVHEAIERARSISKSNVEAVKKRWEADREGLNDCVKELAEMIEEETADGIESDGESGNGGIGDGFSDDGWGELGAGSSKEQHVKASQEDLARLNSAHLLLKFVHGLHKRVLNAFISQAVFLPPSVNMLDQLLSDSNALLHAADELVPALYIPHDTAALSTQLTTLNGVLVAFRAHLTCLGLSAPPGHKPAAVVRQGGSRDCEEVAQTMSSMTLQADSRSQIAQQERPALNDKAISESKWINSCFAQISKSFDAIKVV